MAHPTTRAERRNTRRQAICHGYRDLFFTHWLKPCTCDDLGRGWRSCTIHNGMCSRARLAGKLAKTRPGDWIFDMERDYYASGLLRQAFRAGGGRRSGPAKDWGGGLHNAGPFRLNQALNEWNDNDAGDDV